MKTLPKGVASGLTLFILSTPLAARANPENYPDAPVKLIVSYAAGNVTDSVARTIGERLSAKWKQPVVVENRPGAGGNLGAATVARTAPNGQTLLFTAVAAMAVNPHLYGNVGYDPRKDFEFVSLAVWTPLVCVVAPDLPVQSFSELIRYTKQHPGKVNYGSSGSGTISHLTMEQMKANHGFDVTHVPYKGSSAVMSDLMGGLIQVGCEPANVTMPLVKAGKLRAVGVTSAKPLPAVPGVPTLASQLDGFTSGAWLGVMAPRGTPTLVINKINNDIQAVLADKDVRAKFSDLGLEIIGEGPANFEKRLHADYEEYGQLVRRLNLKVQ